MIEDALYENQDFFKEAAGDYGTVFVGETPDLGEQQCLLPWNDRAGIAITWR
ncbi:hypothetical protein [Micromonospora auratinigra]|uniref:hypothetical protein n=1 Tax=Micromonospora auratinigra TaxID=261654 RepID=UPI0012FDF570|nr:hypothetical protein [Micromonospora auratinigra]